MVEIKDKKQYFHNGVTHNGWSFCGDFKCIQFNENVLHSNEISLKYVSNGSVDDKPALI